MKIVFVILLIAASLDVYAHPGIGIVKNSRGLIYYTDLRHIYQLDPKNGERKKIVPNVHSHELYIDAQDNLYGEHLWFADERTNRFDHYLWRLNAAGKLDTLTGTENAYADFDFSLYRDRNGNEYRVQSFTTDKILKKDKNGEVTVIASGSFKDIAWLHPAEDGTVYFSQGNAVYKIASKDSILKIADHISPDEKNTGIYRIWQKQFPGALYVAVTGDRSIKKIEDNGVVENVFTETEKDWFPTGGVFDNDGNLWLLEYNSANEVRVVKAGSALRSAQGQVAKKRYWLAGLLFVCIGVFLYRSRKRRTTVKDPH